MTGCDRAEAVTAVARALESAGIRWCHLRGSQDGTDVDLLVEAGRTHDVDAAMVTAGFVKLRAWGRQRFYLTMSAGPARPCDWLAVHVTDELAFGRHYELVLGGADACLGRVVTGAGGAPTIAGEDEFWVILLHALLDKGHLAEKHRERLRVLAPVATPSGSVAERLAQRAGPSWPPDLYELAAAGKWSELEALTPQLRASFGLRRVAGRRLRNRSALVARKATEPVTSRGIAVALLGPDGSGKSTLATRLCHSYFFGGRVVYLGLHSAADPVVSLPGVRFLHRLGRVAWRSLGARYHMARRRIVVFDRHPYDALAIGRTRPIVARALTAAAVAPDLVLVLDAPAEVLHDRSGEHSPAQLDRMRVGYLALAHRLRNAEVIDTTVDPDAIVAQAITAVWNAIRSRAGQPPR